jgi:hypothetical protein
VKKRLTHGLKLILIISLILPLLASCVSGEFFSVGYPLESVSGSGSETSYVYRAAGQSVPETAEALIASRKPVQQSAEDPERMFLVYPDELIHLQRDPDRPQDTLIEVSSREYVRRNYSPGFLEGYLLASLINDLFDGGRYAGGGYRGYGSKDTYKPKQAYRTPTIEDKKTAPPVTVNRTGSIFRRSPDANATVSPSGGKAEQPSSSPGRIVRDSGSSDRSKGVFFKPTKPKAPKIKFGTGRIGRRR